MIDNYLNHATSEHYIIVCDMWRHIGNMYRAFDETDDPLDYEMFPMDWEHKNDYIDGEVYEDVFEY